MTAPPKAPIDCILLSILWSCFLKERMASASVAMSCVAEASIEINAKITTSMISERTLISPVAKSATAYINSVAIIVRL